MAMLIAAYKYRDNVRRRHGLPGAERLPMAVRFWRQVAPSDGCWVWVGPTMEDGYGVFTLGQKSTKKMVRTHRLAWEMQRGPIPDGQCVLHRCDNPPCVRVSHLFLGSNLDNIADKVAKRRQARAECHTSSKLTWAQVDEIRRRCHEGESRLALAREFGVHSTTVNYLVRGKSWNESLRQHGAR